jgi:electron transport complex protein RnfE
VSRLGEFTKGLLRENPTFVLVLGLCPTLATTTSAKNAVGMGLAATFVLLGSNVIISLISSLVPRPIRIPCYIVVIASFTTMVQMLLKGYVPALDRSLGIFIPLIVVNCIIFARAEAFASKRGVVDSALDALGMGTGFTIGLLSVSTIREVLGSWRFFDVPLTDGGFDPAKVMGMAPGAFIVLGLVLAVVAIVTGRGRTLRRAALADTERMLFEAARPNPEAEKAEKSGRSEAGGEGGKPSDEAGADGKQA